MARPEEKAQSMLNRYLREQKGESSNTRRPHLASLCQDLPSAGRWRAQVERDIRLRVTEIHNSSLSASRVRELNDSINRLIRERRHWDRRVVQLGGRSIPQPRTTDDDGVQHGGYLYFGAARELPEVRDVLKRAESNESNEEMMTESNQVLYARLNGEYYNAEYNDEEEMKNAEQIVREGIEMEWKERGLSDKGFEWDDSFRKCIGEKPIIVEETTNIQEKKGDEEMENEEEQRQERKRRMVKEMLGSG